MNFYKFVHKQLLVVIAIFLGTGLGYIYIGSFYDSQAYEPIWFLTVVFLSVWGYLLHRNYEIKDFNLQKKEKWLQHVRYFLFIYFNSWTVMFFIYTSTSLIELHYVAIATQLGVTVVSATILVSQKRLAIVTLITTMAPLTFYFIALGTVYSYLLAVFSIVLSGVLLYASSNTYNYLVKSKFQAYHDYLTKLGNRRYFIRLLEDAIKTQHIDKKAIYLLLIDLDHFKTINDTLGHDIGDALLCQVATRMKKLSKKHNNTVARLGGDEFCILSSTCIHQDTCLQEAIGFATELLDIIKETYIIEGHHLYISASIGVSLICNPKLQASTFIKEADIAMYEAKSQGRDGIMVFNEKLSHRVERKLDIERLLHFAIEEDEIHLTYQPQMNSADKIIGCEVLARWTNDQLGAVSPDDFIPIAEQTGFIIELGHYILEESFKTFKSWHEKGIYLEQFSINISMRQLFHTSFVTDVQKLCDTYLTDELCSKLMFEMTETSVAEDITQLIEHMNILKQRGIRFSMDDFGTGYSSLSYLRQIPLHELKIDKSFILNLENNTEDADIVKTIVNIAKNMNLRIVAEGVETVDQKNFLIEHNCDVLQGFHFSKPMPQDTFEAFAISLAEE